MNEKNLKLINAELNQINWDDNLIGTNCNENYNIMTSLINRSMEKYSPLQKIRISSKRIFIEPWMSRGLEVSAKKKDRLYKKHLHPTVQKVIFYLTKITGTSTIKLNTT